MTIYQLHDFLHYPNFANRLAMVRPYNCCAREPWHWWQRVWFAYGALCLFYQTFGLLIGLQQSLAQQLKREANVPIDSALIFAQISEAGGIMGLTIVGTCKMWTLLSKGERIAALLQEFQRIFPNAQMQACNAYRLTYFAQTSQRLMKRIAAFNLFASAYYDVLPIIISLYELAIVGELSEIHYQSNTWYPWHMLHAATIKTTSFWPICGAIATYVCQLQASLTGIAFILGGEFMVCFFLTQMRLHYDYLARALKQLNAKAPNANAQLKRIIVYHNRLLRLTKEINGIFNMAFLVNFSTSAIAICLMGFAGLMVKPLPALKYSFGVLVFVEFTAFLCYNGTKFSDASLEIFSAAFHHNWQEGDVAYRKMLLFFMLRAKDANTLMAYKFYTISMETFIAILKFSYQLFTLFCAMS